LIDAKGENESERTSYGAVWENVGWSCCLLVTTLCQFQWP